MSLFSRFKKIKFKHMPCPDMTRTLKLGPNGFQTLREMMWGPPRDANTYPEARKWVKREVVANPVQTFLKN